MVTLGCVQTGCKMLIVKLFDPNVVCRIIEEHRVSTILGVPTMLVALLEALEKEPVDVSSLKDFSSGGAMVAPELIRNIQRVFSCRFSTLYGQTETSPVITQNFPDDSIDNVCHTIGQPLPQTEVSIRCLESNKVVGLWIEKTVTCLQWKSLLLEAPRYHPNWYARFGTVLDAVCNRLSDRPRPRR